MGKKKEVEIEDKDVFVKIDPYDSIDLKKALLEMTASNINMQIIAERFKQARNDEMKRRGVAKRHMKETALLIAEMADKLPKAKEIHAIHKGQKENPSSEKKEVKMNANLPEKERHLMSELEDIKRKIAGIN